MTEIVNPLPPHKTILTIAGVSYRQDVVRQVEAGQQLRLIADPTNARDPHAIAVVAGADTLLGFVRATMTERLHVTGATVWHAEIAEVLHGDTIGLRVRYLGPSDEIANAPGAVPRTAPDPPPAPDARTVRTRAGRELGMYAGTDGTRTLVRIASGAVVPYPSAVCDVA
jgi:hypothetical protein